jgi:hypothetical protein
MVLQDTCSGGVSLHLVTSSSLSCVCFTEYLENMTIGEDTEDAYPYNGKQGTCKFMPKGVGSTIAGHVDVPEGDEEACESSPPLCRMQLCQCFWLCCVKMGVVMSCVRTAPVFTSSHVMREDLVMHMPHMNIFTHAYMMFVP